jgi:3-oxoacyl-[acyl-carrier protein] reductase
MNIIITGASRGIGNDLAKLFSEENQANILLVSRNEAKLAELCQDCKSINPSAKVNYLVADVAELSPDFSETVKLYMDKVDILVNNAGLLINKPFQEITREEANRVYQVNILGVINTIQLLLPLLEKADLPHVINISSMGGFQGSVKFPGLAIYSSSKAALASLTECLALEYSGKIIFNCLALGAVQTEMLAAAFPGYQAPVTSGEMAAFIKYFAVEGKKFFNGKVLPVSCSTP